jgi:predicted DCC family thiol-disulfide oxidoreductase YuxK
VAGAQLWLIALHAALTLRRSGALWREGRALAYALADEAWTTALGVALARHAPSSLLQAASYVAWLSPLIIALLLLVPLRGARRAGLVYMVLYHLGASLFVRDVLSQWALCAAAPLFITSEGWERWIARRARGRRELAVIYDGDCGVCFIICRTLRRLDGYGRLRFVANDGPAVPDRIPADVLASTVVVVGGPDEPVLTKAAAIAAVIAALPGGRAVAWWLRRPAIARIGDRGYDAFAARRATVSQWLGFDACGIPGTSRAPAPPAASSRAEAAPIARGLRAVPALVLAVVCGYALAQDGESGPRPRTTALDVAVRYARLAPAADRWAPEPSRRAGALVVEGVTASGVHVDPLTGQAPRTSPLAGSPAESAPALLAYFERIHESRYAVYLDGLRDYVKRTAAAAEPAQRVSAFNVVWLAAPLAVAGDGDAPSAPEVSRTELGAYP